MSGEKEILWIGSAYADLILFPDAPRSEAGFQLGKVQAGLEPTDWKPFDEVGAGIKEIRIKDVSGGYRVMYVAKFDEAIYVLHCFQKKTQTTSRQDKFIAQIRYRAVINLRKKSMKKTIDCYEVDTEVRHITKAGANLFLELGFAPDEAMRLQAASKNQINNTQQLKQQLMQELATWIAENHLKQADAAKILMVSRPRVSDVVNQKATKFTIDTLVNMLSLVGKPVRLSL